LVVRLICRSVALQQVICN